MPTSRGLRHAIVLATLIAGSPARGQELQELDTDRDAFTPATRPVAVGHVLTEASYSFIDNRGTPATNSFPELLIRRGATERFEWRLGFNYESGSGGSVVTAVEGGEGVEGDELASESNILYGFKALVTEQGGWAPRSSVIIEAFTPLSGDVWGTEPAITYAFGWELPRTWRLDAAIRYVLADSAEGLFDKWLPSAVLRMPVTERWEVHAEWFGSWTDGLEDEKVRPFVGPGTHFMITPSLEIGCRMGWGLTQDAAAYFVDTPAWMRRNPCGRARTTPGWRGAPDAALDSTVGRQAPRVGFVAIAFSRPKTGLAESKRRRIRRSVNFARSRRRSHAGGGRMSSSSDRQGNCRESVPNTR